MTCPNEWAMNIHISTIRLHIDIVLHNPQHILILPLCQPLASADKNSALVWLEVWDAPTCSWVVPARKETLLNYSVWFCKGLEARVRMNFWICWIFSGTWSLDNGKKQIQCTHQIAKGKSKGAYIWVFVVFIQAYCLRVKPKCELSKYWTVQRCRTVCPREGHGQSSVTLKRPRQAPFQALKYFRWQ